MELLLCRRIGECIYDLVNDLLDQHLVITLPHDADHRLGARRAHDQPTMMGDKAYSASLIGPTRRQWWQLTNIDPQPAPREFFNLSQNLWMDFRVSRA
jgi:hypothetical protein